jgi:tetratricopeptide (TPR) repeat protein
MFARKLSACTPGSILTGLVLLFSFDAVAQDAQPDPAAAIPPLLKEGDAFYLKGDYEAARQSFTKAWDLAQQTPNDNPVRYDICKRLTSVRAAAGEFADADNWLQQAVTWRENILGQTDAGIPDDLIVSVNLCRGMKDFDRALYIIQRVRTLHVAAFTMNSTPVADDFSRAAQIYLEQKKPESAINSLNAAVEIRTRLNGPLHPSLVPDLDRLGELYITVRSYGKAEDAYRHVLVIRETLYGKTHADLISTVDGLAYAIFGQKKYDVAEPIYQRLISLWEESVGRDHPMVAVALDKVAVFYAEQKKFDEARAALERSTAIRAHFLATGLSQQATEEFSENHLDQAKAFYVRALAVLDPPNPINEELRAQFEGILKTFEQTQMPSKPPPRRKK